MIPVMPPTVSRRALLRSGGLVGLAGLLAACDGSEGPDSTSPTGAVEPDDPTTWPPDTTLLLSARQRVHGYLAALEVVEVPSGRASRLRDAWEAQLETVEQLVTLGGVPLPAPPTDPVVTAAPDDTARTTAPTDDADRTAGPERPPADRLGQVLRADVTEALRDASTATPTHLAMLVSVAAQHAASAQELGAAVDWPPLAGPRDAAAVPLLAALRPAVFGLEVLAARSRGEERADYESVLEEVAGLTRQLTSLAGRAAPVPPLGYDLPEPLADREDRRDLAVRLVADVAPAALTTATRVSGDVAQLTGVARVVAEAVSWDRRLGGRGSPFPGMTAP
ncbi:hypothetical protein BJF81_03695 [Ornithinimicrobium sp. CNJ-824]|uniref:DUF4439 domain-containing protein n=1 Tax=Ornithinimicrobium sp. CNJ-824 TaxID=1904966 RepID=UPI00096998EE|nr:DUF4439 domain-containing protein [Ornithinimicrobium sp. CNJ-824]OLT20965.1 hypothetical protein BJF81_03695 [Ornithinimicrobium sp. CNJ-824]